MSLRALNVYYSQDELFRLIAADLGVPERTITSTHFTYVELKDGDEPQEVRCFRIESEEMPQVTFRIPRLSAEEFRGAHARKPVSSERLIVKRAASGR